MVVALLLLIVLVLSVLLAGWVGLVVAIAIAGLVASAFAGLGWLALFIVGALFVVGLVVEAKDSRKRPPLTEAERVALGGWSNAQCWRFLAIWYAVPVLLIFGSWLLANAMK
ncbi:hypothetical protein [Hyphomicrobium sp. 2TAF46]|uniref:hypothetical protein n=1 Tax=Hyphomicrobium sp. 2TAF46 TaxID=3233019 RepID=UPI003F91ECD1